MRRFIIISILTTICLIVSNCALIPVYKPDIEQGNIITPSMIAQLKIGMTPEQARYIMGSPVLTTTFNPNQWEYIYVFQTRSTVHKRKHVALYFVNGRLARYTYRN